MTAFKDRGRWRYAFQKNGKRIQGWWYATKTEAKAAEAEARKKFKTRKLTNTSFLALCNSRLDALKSERTASHFVKNRRLLKNLMNRWEKKKTVTQEDVREYLAWAKTPKRKKITHNIITRKKEEKTYHVEIVSGSHSLANRHLRLIRALFRHGINVGIWEDDPTKGIKAYSTTDSKRYVPPIEHIRKVLEVATEEQRAYLTVLIHTMARVDAVNNLKWEDVHAEHLILRTRKARNSNEKEIPIPLNQTLKDTLATLPRESEYVFTSRMTGTRYRYRNNLMKILCKAADVKRFSYHALRHFGASRLVQQGVPLTDVQQLLGHEKVTTTAIYLRSMGEGVKEAVKKLEGI